MKRRALDLFCGGGGVALGLLDAGFDVYGVDIEDHSRAYPGVFILGDATRPPVDLRDFALVWASPPCQAFSASTHPSRRESHPNLIPVTRALLSAHRYTVIENVPYAPIRSDLVLTGQMLGLSRLYRPRHFEMSFRVQQPPIRPYVYSEGMPPAPISQHMSYQRHSWKFIKAHDLGRISLRRSEAAEFMGIDLDRAPMTRREIGESIPPVMAEWIGRKALAHMDGQRESLFD